MAPTAQGWEIEIDFPYELPQSLLNELEAACDGIPLRVDVTEVARAY